VWLSALLFFLYVGTEISLGTWAYSLLTESRGIAAQTAGFWTGSFWATFTIGRILAGLFAKRVGSKILVKGGVALAFLGAVLLLWNPSQTMNLVAVAIMGFAIAPVFPAMMSGTSQRVSAKFAANTIGMQMAASGLGGAAIPGLVGVLARQVSLEIVPVCLVVLFAGLFVVFHFAQPRIKPFIASTQVE
jgi:fucose permease